MKVLGIVTAFVVAAACSVHGGTGAATSSRSSSPSGTPLHGPSGGLDAEVPMPPGFPSDIPIYPGARLTAGASFASSGQVTWGMEWETLDSVDKVRSFYSKQLSQGDWSISSSGTSGGVYAAVFARKSNSHATGILGVDGSSGVTKISMSFVTTT